MRIAGFTLCLKPCQAFAEPMRSITHDGKLSAYDVSGRMIVAC